MTTEKTFKTLSALTEKEMLKALPKMLRKVGYNPIVTNEYIYAEGDIPIALCAHMDIVGAEPPSNLFYDTDKNVIWAGGHILGADDRAGITAIWEIIKRKEYKPHLIFTTGEETGAAGAHALAIHGNPFKELKFIIELDRANNNDCVFYDCDNPQFEEYINSFGFETEYGTFTDISILCPSWKVAGVNLSVGYYFEHTKYEHLKFDELEETIKRVMNILSDKNSKSYEYIPAIGMLSYYQFECSFCGKRKGYPELHDVLLPSGLSALACNSCMRQHKRIHKCKICNEYFYANNGNETICYDCDTEVNNGQRTY